MNVKLMFHKLEDWFEKLATDANKADLVASSTLKYVAPLVEGIATATMGEAASAEIKAIITETQTDLATAAMFLPEVSTPGSSAGATVTNLLSSVQSNLKGLLAAGHIKNTATISKVTGVVDVITGELGAVISSLPSATAAK